MKVIVTGCSGFVGRHLVPWLRDRGDEVLGIDLHASSAPPPGTSFMEADIREVERYRGSLCGADAIVHMASAHLQVGLPDTTYESVNVASLAPLVRAAERAGVRHFVHTSSVGVHGSLAAVPGDEDAPLRPDNVYERTKAAGEREIGRLLAEPMDMGVTVVRPAWIYGVEDARTERLLRSVSEGTFVLFGRGENRRHPIHVRDYLEGVGRLLLEPRTYGKTYLLAGPEPLTTRELLRAAERVTGGRVRVRLPIAAGTLAGLLAEVAARPLGVAPPISRRTMAFFRNENAFDTGRAARDFGFAPRVGLDEGLAEVWERMLARKADRAAAAARGARAASGTGPHAEAA